MMSPSGVYLRKNAQRKFDAVLKAASRLFLKRGYTRTSMDMIAASAGVSKQTVYSYFTNKDVLFSQMIEAEVSRHSVPDSVLENGTLAPEEALYRIGRGFLDAVTGQRGLAIYRLVMEEAERHPRIARLFFDSGPERVQRTLRNYLERQVAAGIFAIPNVDSAATFFFAMVRARHQQRLLLKLKPAPGKKEYDEHVRETVRLFFKMYGKAPQAHTA